MNDTTALKIKILKEMNDYVLEAIGDDDITMYWLRDGVPDACDDEMYRFIAETPVSWLNTINCFANICKMVGILDDFDEDIEKIPF